MGSFQSLRNQYLLTDGRREGVAVFSGIANTESHTRVDSAI